MVADGDRGGVQRHLWDLVSALPSRETVLVAGSAGWLTDQAATAAVGVHLLPGLSRRAPLRCLRGAALALGRLIAETGPTLVHAHGAKALVIAKAALASADPALVATSHGFAAFDPSRPWAQRSLLLAAERWRKGRLDAFIGVSTKECALARRIGVPAAQIHYIANGVEIGSDPPWRAGEIRRLAFAGRLVAEKGVRLLPQIARALPPGAVLEVAGDGPLRPWLEREAIAANMAGRLRLKGWVEPLVPWLGQMDAFLLPSAKEGLPYALLEAAERALPIVAFDVGGVSDLLAEGVSGRVVPAGQDSAFILAVVSLWLQKGRPWAWGRQAREEVRQRFGVEQMREATLALYRQVLERGAR